MKYLYVATVLSHICQFHLPHMKKLKDNGHIVHVAAHDNLSVKNGLSLKYADQFYEVPFERSPFDPKNIRALSELRKVIGQNYYDVIICNTPVGGVLTRIGAVKARKKGTRVIYIAHGFHFYNGASKKNWLIFYPLERTLAHMNDTLITINEEDYQFAKERFSCNVAHIHGIGVDSERYHPISNEKQIGWRLENGYSPDDFMILCTGELNDNKNQKTLISAASLLKAKGRSIKILLAGNGPNEQTLKNQIKMNNLENMIDLLGYRTDLETILPSVDLVVSCSYREGMPLNIIEAMLCRKPVLASINRGHKELVSSGENGYLFDPDDYVSLAARIAEIANDKDLAMRFGECGFNRAQAYTSDHVWEELEALIM
ncbi:MAG: glycosyltransferase family 4 protein [Erysipelotrichaceae bacterium]|nr:glycosyltransferase family 4 protein [Erysipelotrichaceae bacterium]